MLIREDKYGLYIRGRDVNVKESPYRPGDFRGHSHAWNTTDAGLKAGDKPKTSHVNGAPFIKITLDDGTFAYWGSWQRTEGDFDVDEVIEQRRLDVGVETVAPHLKREEGWYPVTNEFTSMGKTTTIQENISGIDRGGITFDDLRRQLKDIEKEHGDQYEKFKVQLDERYGFYDDIEISYNVYGYRKETDEEYNERVDEFEARQKALADNDRAQYERLKKRFGDA